MLMNDDNCRALWASVMIQAIKDLDGKYSTDRKLAYHYVFLEPDGGAGSFLWVCGVLGLEPDAVRAAVMTREGRARIKDKNRPRLRRKVSTFNTGETDYGY